MITAANKMNYDFCDSNDSRDKRVIVEVMCSADSVNADFSRSKSLTNHGNKMNYDFCDSNDSRDKRVLV